MHTCSCGVCKSFLYREEIKALYDVVCTFLDDLIFLYNKNIKDELDKQ